MRCHKQDGEVVGGKVLIIGHDHWVWEKVTAEKGALGSKVRLATSVAKNNEEGMLMVCFGEGKWEMFCHRHGKEQQQTCHECGKERKGG